MRKARIMFNMTVEEVRDGLKDMKTVILPVGCVEQHGYHLPLSVDIHNAAELASRASDLCGCFVAPTVQYSFSGGMLPGTINISPQVFSMLLRDICQSLVVQGFKNIIILMGHGGTECNRAAYDAVEMFQSLNPQMSGITVSVVPFPDMSHTYTQCMDERDYHAGKYETSLMLYWKPELVKLDRARLDTQDLVDLMRSDPDAYLIESKEVDSKFVYPKKTQRSDIEVGVMGDFTGASPELGAQIAGEVAQGLAEFVAKLESR